MRSYLKFWITSKSLCSVATNLENLEYSGISLNMENSRKFCATSGKNCNKLSIFSLSFRYLYNTAVDWVNRTIGNRDEVRVRWWPVILLKWMWNDPCWRSLLHLLFVAITYGKVSLWLWKSLDFFLLLCGHPVMAFYGQLLRKWFARVHCIAAVLHYSVSRDHPECRT